MPKGNYITPEILHDAPLEKGDNFDFHFNEFASTLARLIASKKTKTPLAICVSGAWGAGKTTLLQRIKMMLDETYVLRNPSAPELLEFVNPDESPRENFRFCRTVWFNAWKYSDEDELLVALIRRILQEMSDDSFVAEIMYKLLDPTYPRRDIVRTVLSWFKISLPGVEIGLNTGEPIPTQISEKIAILDLFDDAFNQLIAAWVHGKLDIKKTDPQEGVLAIFIDDLDRCLPEKMVQILEAVKLFLDKKGCIFILGADVAIIQQAIIKNYRDAGVTGDSAKDYLDKIIQLRFELPPIIETRMYDYLTSTGATVKDWGRSWELLISGANMNPRSVKAFVNDSNLQWSMLINLLGETEQINRSDFNAWQVLVRIAPFNFIKHIRFVLHNPLHRWEYVFNAIRWAGGDKSQDEHYNSYGDDFLLKRVLQEISFSTSFSPSVLDAFLYLADPSITFDLRNNSLAEGRLISENKLKIFVSYSIEDKKTVDYLVRQLRSDGADVWLDTEIFGAREDWVEIQRIVHEFDCIFVCVSNASRKSKYLTYQLIIIEEISTKKLNEDFYVFPIRLDDCELPLFLRQYNSIDFFGQHKLNNYYRKIIYSLNNRAQQLGREKLKGSIWVELENQKISKRKSIKSSSTNTKLGKKKPSIKSKDAHRRVKKKPTK